MSNINISFGQAEILRKRLNKTSNDSTSQYDADISYKTYGGAVVHAGKYQIPATSLKDAEARFRFIIARAHETKKEFVIFNKLAKHV